MLLLADRHVQQLGSQCLNQIEKQWIIIRRNIGKQRIDKSKFQLLLFIMRSEIQNIMILSLHWHLLWCVCRRKKNLNLYFSFIEFEKKNQFNINQKNIDFSSFQIQICIFVRIQLKIVLCVKFSIEDEQNCKIVLYI